MSRQRKKQTDDQVKKKPSKDFFDKIVEQGTYLMLSFILSTALVGGSGYLLFELPNEKIEIERRLIEMNNKANDIAEVNHLLDLVTNGSLFSSEDNSNMETLLDHLLINIMEPSLDSSISISASNWLTKVISQSAKEKGQINGIEINGGIEKNFQVNIVKEYDLKISILGELLELIINWEQENLDEKDNRLEKIQLLVVDSIANLSAIGSQLNQLRANYENQKQEVAQTSSELSTQLNIIYIKFSLSGTGVIVGLSVLFIIIKRFREKIN